MRAPARAEASRRRDREVSALVCPCSGTARNWHGQGVRFEQASLATSALGKVCSLPRRLQRRRSRGLPTQQGNHQPRRSLAPHLQLLHRIAHHYPVTAISCRHSGGRTRWRQSRQRQQSRRRSSAWSCCRPPRTSCSPRRSGHAAAMLRGCCPQQTRRGLQAGWLRSAAITIMKHATYQGSPRCHNANKAQSAGLKR